MDAGDRPLAGMLVRECQQHGQSPPSTASESGRFHSDRGAAWRPAANGALGTLVQQSVLDDVEARQARRLRQLLKYDTAVEFVAAVAVLGMFVAFGSPALLIVGLVLSANTVVLVWVRRLVDEGRLQAAVTAMAVALWLVAVAVAVFIPAAFVVAPLLLMQSVLVALPYADRRRLRQLITGAVVTAVAITPFVRAQDGLFPLELPEWFVVTVLVIAVPGAMAVTLYFASQYSDLLREALDQSQHANAALRDSQVLLAAHVEELRASRARILDAQEAVRREIARHIHGRVQSRLILLRAQLLEHAAHAAHTRTDSGDCGHLDDVAETLAEIAQNELGTLSRRLYPAILSRGLVPAIESLVDEFEPAVDIALAIDPGLRADERARPDQVPAATRLAAYRIVEEGLTNIVKHSGASSVCLTLDRPRGERVRLTVADNGHGFDPDTARGGLGMAAIRDQAATVGGVIEVRSAPGQGTEIVASLPN